MHFDSINRIHLVYNYFSIPSNSKSSYSEEKLNTKTENTTRVRVVVDVESDVN